MIIKLLKGFTVFEVGSCIIGGIINLIFGDLVNGLMLFFNAFYTIIILGSIITAYNRSLLNEEKINKLRRGDNTELKDKISSLERQIALLKNKLAISDAASTDTAVSKESISLECPFCGKPISQDDKECSFCGFDLKNGTN